MNTNVFFELFFGITFIKEIVMNNDTFIDIHCIYIFSFDFLESFGIVQNYNCVEREREKVDINLQ